jgi:hypothetical protein
VQKSKFLVRLRFVQINLTSEVVSLTETDWRQQEENHFRKLSPLVIPHLKRRDLGEQHAVYDFLFSYYSFRVSLLMRWSPGIEFLLEGKSAEKFLDNSQFLRIENKISLDPRQFPLDRLESAKWILNLLEKTNDRPMQLGCAGLHEWAMECEANVKRYPHIPLRISPDDLKAFLKSQNLNCSHYDAFRFFTPSTKPLNQLTPTKIKQPELEQRGCLHVNMDLYKWAYKFYPWISSNLIADAFLLAIKAREIDMRASPYDLRDLGFEPIAIETTQGRIDYSNLQLRIAEEGVAIRQNLISAYRSMIDWARSI